MSFKKWERPELLHLILNGLYEFCAKRGELPRLNNEEDSEYLYELVN